MAVQQAAQQVQVQRKGAPKKAPGAKRDRSSNPMKGIMMDKLVINMGTGSESNIQGNAKRLLELITSRKPADAISKKRNPAFKISKGHKIGAFVTIRGEEAKPLAKKLLGAVDNRLKQTAVTDNALNFGIHEYIDIAGIKYDPTIGMLGMNVNLTFRRKGMRVALRKRRQSGIPSRHRIVSRDDVVAFVKKEFGTEFVQ